MVASDSQVISFNGCRCHLYSVVGVECPNMSIIWCLKKPLSYTTIFQNVTCHKHLGKMVLLSGVCQVKYFFDFFFSNPDKAYLTVLFAASLPVCSNHPRAP